MAQKNETAVLILALLITAGVLGGGYWWFTRRSAENLGNLQQSGDKLPSPPSPSQVTAFAPPASVPAGTTVKINGSTSLVRVNQYLKNSFEQQFPGTQVITDARGSEEGIGELQAGQIDLAAISRPLTPQEQGQGLVAIPIARDGIAIVVGVNNGFRRGLTRQQVKEIFQGKITDWAAVGGPSGTIRVLNRPSISGTYETFQKLVLEGESFGTTPNITTLERDATTPLLRELGSNGIGYATYTQVADQRTVRTVPVDGLTPESPQYPFQRELYYAYKQPASPAVQAFLGYATSPKGQQVISQAMGF